MLKYYEELAKAIVCRLNNGTSTFTVEDKEGGKEIIVDEEISPFILKIFIPADGIIKIRLVKDIIVYESSWFITEEDTIEADTERFFSTVTELTKEALKKWMKSFLPTDE